MTAAESAAILEAIAEARQRFVALATAAPPDLRVPATPAWTVADVVGHVAMEPKRYLDLIDGTGEWPQRVADLPVFNARQVANLPTRDPDRLGRMIDEHFGRLERTVADFGDAAPLMPFDGGQTVSADRQLGTLLGELLVHGRDIAVATGADWRIDPVHVPLVFLGLHQVLPGWVDPRRAAGHTAVYELRLRGSCRYVYAFADGTLEVDPPQHPPIDVHISLDPVTALLSSYGRIGRLGPALTGAVRAWGRRPWLALTLRDRFQQA